MDSVVKYSQKFTKQHYMTIIAILVVALTLVAFKYLHEKKEVIAEKFASLVKGEEETPVDNSGMYPEVFEKTQYTPPYEKKCDCEECSAEKK
jgi:hypothetical protein